MVELSPLWRGFFVCGPNRELYARGYTAGLGHGLFQWCGSHLRCAADCAIQFVGLPVASGKPTLLSPASAGLFRAGWVGMPTQQPIARLAVTLCLPRPSSRSWFHPPPALCEVSTARPASFPPEDGRRECDSETVHSSVSRTIGPARRHRGGDDQRARSGHRLGCRGRPPAHEDSRVVPPVTTSPAATDCAIAIVGFALSQRQPALIWNLSPASAGLFRAVSRTPAHMTKAFGNQTE